VFGWNFLLDAEGGLIRASLVLISLILAPAISIATGIAILKYRLYDIDRIANRALVYAVLTASLVLVYLASVASLQYAFRAITGGDSQLAVVASTLVIAGLFNPLRRRIQAFIDRGFYRRKYDAAKTLAVFSSSLREETDLDSLGEDLVGVVRETMHPAHVSPWLHPSGRIGRGKDEAKYERISVRGVLVTLFVTFGRRSVRRMVAKEVR
jgi:hypothetical protein